MKKDEKYGQKLIMEESILKKMTTKKKVEEEPSGLKRLDQMRDQDDEQKKMPEEDFENKKLLPVLQ